MLVETAILYVALTYGAATCRSGRSSVEFDSLNGEQETIHEIVEAALVSGYTDITAGVLAKDFGSIPQVDFVLTEDLSDTLLVWIVVSDPTPEVRKRIYEKQLSLISEFPDMPFDFNLVRTQGRKPSELVTGANVVFSRQE
jgi:hypothetical protein